jgi:hypothetical protein
MANTTNFNWETPDDTDLVKDGAAAIRTLGNSIDTSFVDLKGGTTGQVLAKASNTDLDFTWASDATGIPATIFDAKGDLIAASAADTAARLAVGTNGQVLTADSSTSTGLKWASAGTTFSGVMLYCNSGQSISNNTFTAATNWAEDIDTDGYYNSGTSTSRITIPTGKSGKFLIQMQCQWADNATGLRRLRLYKNGTGSSIWSARNRYLDGSSQSQAINVVQSLSAGDYIEMYGFQGSGGSLEFISVECSWFGVTYLGA